MQRSERMRKPEHADVIALTLAWIAVGVPLLWGVSQTVVKSLALIGR